MTEKKSENTVIAETSVKKVRRGSFMRDTASLVGGSVIAQVITVASTPIITRLFSPDALGVFAIVMALVGPFVAMAGLRYHEAMMLPKSDAEAGALFRLAMLLVALLGLILFGVVIFLGPQIVRVMHFSGDPAILYVVPVLVILLGARRVLDARMQRARAYGRIVMAKVSVVVVDRIISIGAGLAGHATPWPLIFARIGGLCSSALWMSAPLQRPHDNPVEESSGITMTAVARRYAGFATYSWSGLVQQVNRELPVIVIGSVFGVATAGLFALARRMLIEPGVLVGESLSKTFYQRASEVYSSGGSIAGLSTELIGYLFRWIIPPMVIFSFVAPDVFALCFGAEWRLAGTYSVLMMPMFISGFVMHPLGRLFMVTERQREWASFTLLSLLGIILVLGVGVLSGSVEVTFGMMSLLMVVLSASRARWILSLIGVPKNAIWPVLFNCLLRAVLWSAPVLVLKMVIRSPDWVVTVAAAISIAAYLGYLLVSDPRFNRRLGKLRG